MSDKKSIGKILNHKNWKSAEHATFEGLYRANYLMLVDHCFLIALFHIYCILMKQLINFEQFALWLKLTKREEKKKILRFFRPFLKLLS